MNNPRTEIPGTSPQSSSSCRNPQQIRSPKSETRRLTRMGFCLLLSVFCFSTLAQTTAFTYQGRLNEGANPASGIYNLRFTIYDAASGGGPVASALDLTGVAITNGLFTVLLDFGMGVFTGPDRWLEIGVVTNGGVGFNTLSPRQGLAATPYAVRASSATTVPAGTITSLMLADNSVTAEKLAAGAVSQLGTPDGSLLNAVQVHTNGLVGIGTNGPDAGLHIVGGKVVLTPRLLFQAVDGAGDYSRLAGARDVALSGNLLAVAASQDSGVTILTVSNASAPVLHSQIFDGFAFWTNLAGASAVAFAGNLLAVAAPNDHAVTLIGVGAPGVLTKWAELRDGVGGYNYLGGARAVAFAGNLLAIAAAEDHAVTIVDVSNPASPVLRSVLLDGIGGYNDLDYAGAVAISGNLLAIAADQANAVTLVDISNPAGPVFRAVLKDGVGGFNHLNGAQQMAFSGSLLAIAARVDDAVTIVDVSNPTIPVLRAVLYDGVNGMDYLDGPRGLAFSGSQLAIAAASDNAITLVDVIDPVNPSLQAVFRNSRSGLLNLDVPQAVAFAGSVLAVAASAQSSITLIEPLPEHSSVVSEGWMGVGTLRPEAALHVIGNLLVEGGERAEVRAGRVALGLGTEARAAGATAMGINTTAHREAATAMGRNTVASGFGATAMGFQSFAAGDYATAMGGSSASGEYSTAMGASFAQGFAATAMGDGATASGAAATAMGASTFASGPASIAIGGWSEATNAYAMAAGHRAKAFHAGAFVWADSQNADFASQRANQFRARAEGGARFDVNDNAWVDIRYQSNLVTSPRILNSSSGAYLSLGGAWVNASDRARKNHFRPVNPQAVLEKLVALPLSEWSYKAEGESVRHLGPMAQDFQAAFGLGGDDTSITTVDADGVALAAIQGLNQKVESGQSDLAELRAENAALKARLEKLEQIISQQLNHNAQ